MKLESALTSKDGDIDENRYVLKTKYLILSQGKPFSPSSNCIEFGRQ